MPVGLVLVAHVEQLAEGVRVLAEQMAPDVRIVAAGGTDDGGVGTSFAKIENAVTEADSGDGVVILYDLGSAQLTAELVAETIPDVRLVDAPLVEGAIETAVAAQGGADLEAVAAAARRREAVTQPEPTSAPTASAVTAPGTAPMPAPTRGDLITATVVLPNPLGLHARPAAALARLAAGFDADVRVGRPGQPAVDAKSVITVVAQRILGQEQLEIAASGPAAKPAVDAVLELASTGFGDLAEPAEEAEEIARRPVESGVLQGIGAAPGLAIGPVRHLRRTVPTLPTRVVSPAELATERARLQAAFEKADAELENRVAGGGAAGQIAEAHQAFLADPALREDVERRLELAGLGAERAWWEATVAARDLLAGGGRAIDLEDLALTVLAHLGVPTAGLPDDVAGGVVVAEELLPSQVTALADAGARGVALAGGGRTAHAAIIARGIGLPLVVRMGEAGLEVDEGTPVILDGEAGTFRIEPSRAELTTAEARAHDIAVRQEHERAAAAPRIEGVVVAANVGSLPEARAALASGADGIGLLRTELLFLNRPTPPSEAEQRARLVEILDVMGPDRPVTIRTLDVGGDKFLPYLRLDPTRNGPLGERGLRYGLTHAELLRTQVRAILRAVGDLRASLMAPMVTVPDEVEAFRRIVLEQAAELGCPTPELGVMLEVPAAALDAAPICRLVDFVSVGTNDLTQYLLAADRTLDSVAHLSNSNHPAVWRTIEALTVAARTVGCRVAVCGELAGDPDAAVRLVRLGVSELSMAPPSIPAVKAALRG